MEITIAVCITEKDLMENPNLLDVLKNLIGKEDDKKVITENKVDNWIPEYECVPVTETKETVTKAVTEETLVEETTKYTLEQVRKALGDLAKSKGTGAAKRILTVFDVERVTDLPVETYGRVMKAIKGVL